MFLPPPPPSFNNHLQKTAVSGNLPLMENKKLLIILGVMFVIWLVMALLGLAAKPW